MPVDTSNEASSLSGSERVRTNLNHVEKKMTSVQVAAN